MGWLVDVFVDLVATTEKISSTWKFRVYQLWSSWTIFLGEIFRWKLLEKCSESLYSWRKYNFFWEFLSSFFSENFWKFLWKSSKIFENFRRFSDIFLRISRLFDEYLCNFIYTLRENTIFSDNFWVRFSHWKFENFSEKLCPKIFTDFPIFSENFSTFWWKYM